MRRSRHRPPKWEPKSNFIYVDVERLAATTQDDSFGEDSDPVWSALYSNMKCRFESTRLLTAGQLVMTEAGQVSQSEYLMTFESRFEVKARDRVKDIDGNYYRVNDVRPYGRHTEAFCDIAEDN